MTTAAARDDWERTQGRANGQNNPLTGLPNLTVANDADQDGAPKAKDPVNIAVGEDLDDADPKKGAKK